MSDRRMIAPSYYPAFACIAGACRHTCCVGWEVDIDEDTLSLYENMEGAMGDRIRSTISYEDTPHFCLEAGDRCPHLNSAGLCNIITEAGERCLCQICADHPRFYREERNACEAGVGLACEAAACLILSQEAPVLLCEDAGAGAPAKSRISYRATAFRIVQNRKMPFATRLGVMASMANLDTLPSLPLLWESTFSKMEYMDPEGLPRLLAEAASRWSSRLTWCDREALYGEQLLHYFIYRYMGVRMKSQRRYAAARFAVTSVMAIGALAYQIGAGTPTFEDWVEAARLYSSEIEYSLENVELLMQARYI